MFLMVPWLLAAMRLMGICIYLIILRGDAMPSSILVTSRITGQCTCPIILRLTWHRVPLRIRAKCIYPSIRRYHGARYHGDPENNRVMHLFHGSQGALLPTHPRKMGNAFTILFLG